MSNPVPKQMIPGVYAFWCPNCKAIKYIDVSSAIPCCPTCGYQRRESPKSIPLLTRWVSWICPKCDQGGYRGYQFAKRGDPCECGYCGYVYPMNTVTGGVPDV